MLITAHDFVLNGLNLTVGNQNGIKVDGVSNVTVQNCTVTVSAANQSTYNGYNLNNGIWFNNATTQQLHGGSASGDYVAGFRQYDVLIQGSGEIYYDPNRAPQNPAPVGFTDCQIVNTVCDGLPTLGTGAPAPEGFDGIRVRTNNSPPNTSLTGTPQRQSRPSNFNVIIKSCEVRNIGGTQLGQAGGILLSEVGAGPGAFSYVDHCVAHNNTVNGGYGIWAYNSSFLVIQYCESYANTTGAVDGGGFDFDWGETNSIMQYDYSHDNGGPGFALFSPPHFPETKFNVVRYNISARDVTHSGNQYGGITIWGHTSDSSVSFCDIYNNSIYMSEPGGAGILMLATTVTPNNGKMSEGMRFLNNVIYSTGTGATLFDLFGTFTAPAGANPGTNTEFGNNNYYDTNAADLMAGGKLGFSTQTYSTFSGWTFTPGTGDSTPAGPGSGKHDQEADPEFLWKGTTFAPSPTGTSPLVFEIQGSSPLSDNGKTLVNSDLQSGMSVDTTDFFGALLSGATDIGAAQVSGTVLPTVPAQTTYYLRMGTDTSGNTTLIPEATPNGVLLHTPYVIKNTSAIEIDGGTWTIEVPPPSAAPAGGYAVSTMTLPPLILKDGARLVLPSSANRTGSSATWLNLIIGIQPATPNGRYPSLNIDASSGASLDVGNNALFAANNPDWYVGALVATGRNNGFWDGAGIDSSAITSSLMAVGYATRGGAAVVAYTHVGDATVDGVINVGDLGALATYYGTSINALWDQADFDFNGNVNTNDLGALSTYYNAWSEPWSEPNPV